MNLRMQCTVCQHEDISQKQAWAELGQAQLQMELGFTLINVCLITLMITDYYYIS